MKFTRGCILLLLVLLVACVKNAPTYQKHGVILGYDKSIPCKDKLIMRLDTSIFGYVATGYFSDSLDYQIRNYPSTFYIDTNTVFPIYVLLNCKTDTVPGYCRKHIVDIYQVVRVNK